MHDSDICALCTKEVETLDHSLLGCVHSWETLFRVLRYYALDRLTPQEELPYFDWWLSVRKRVHKSQLKGLYSLVVLVVWSLWKERNKRESCVPASVVGATYLGGSTKVDPSGFAPHILEEARRWTQADFRHVRLAYQPPASSTFISEQTSHQQPASSNFLSEQTSTSHQPNEQTVCLDWLA
jgi:hypothetical protein